MPARSNRTEQKSRYGGDAWAKIISASVGSAITALAVTPLEVVKVRQQAAGINLGGSPPLPTPLSVRDLPPNVHAKPCPRGCGTFVLNTGLGEYLTSRNIAGYFDPKTGALKQQKFVAEVSKTGGPFRIIRSIFVNEGLAGIYAGLAPTLVMGIPNTVLYFYTYEELAPRLRELCPADHPAGGAVPAVAGASARFVASLSTAPLELLRTRQAARSGGGPGAVDDGGRGMVSEFRALVRNEGPLSLFRGVWPTILRDVPFSAIYWMCIEGMRDFWRTRHDSAPSSAVSTSEKTVEALISGSVSGVIAAAFTTPLDVLKTRSQIGTSTIPVAGAASEGTISVASAATVCDHGGALAVHHRCLAMGPSIATTNDKGTAKASSTVQLANSIFEKEGIAGFWRGNTARCMKVAPACGIMIATYETGKRMLAHS
mmetsp:Transcript_8279/g.20435  ORF Transcript_8279/g.20435 Transcript_8279/m.20435 type:complete len:428 (+) Transcript_8279:134-1417(+)|eukprot:CAMPEP_0197191928 /NCGR_PEP_ID=MMETSP1423-20130617/24257_1 /TAXON_ID=476441 /ORGANISM="Pseudo-nitzschia heimii, Strain UNC1101" /LENGTH=427 /DNA_ID=CAMNT_0042644713 /DNA_START=186 /DNA_END=1469 /DNA_ORIENTATION=+